MFSHFEVNISYKTLFISTYCTQFEGFKFFVTKCMAPGNYLPDLDMTAKEKHSLTPLMAMKRTKTQCPEKTKLLLNHGRPQTFFQGGGKNLLFA